MRFQIPRIFRGIFAASVGMWGFQAHLRAQIPGRPAMKKASESIREQEPSKVSPRVLERLTRESSSVLISLSKQRAYLMLGPEIAIDSPISSGKAAGMTPTGSFNVQEKDPDHHSNRYGNFVDRQGRTVRSGVSVQIDSAPSGTHFEGAPMKWFMRVSEGVGMHIGILPGYPASHGCIRMPAEIAPLFYEKCKVGTPVVIER
ncbi:MAG: L,D-transpeptidase family protein [Verrucomicrobiota bacterium]